MLGCCHCNFGRGRFCKTAKRGRAGAAGAALLAASRFDAVAAAPVSCSNWRSFHLGCAPEQEPVPVRWETVDPACVVVDVITNPRITPFLSIAQERGCPIVDGVEMLVQLAMQIFQRWTGLSPDEEVFQRAVAAHFPAISPPTTAIPVSIRWIGGAPRPCCQRVKTDQ